MIFPAADDVAEDPKPTALFAATASESAANIWVSINGWSMARVYSTVREEYEAATKDAGVVDFGALCRYTARGPAAAAVFSRATTAPVDELELGESARGLILNNAGAVVDIIDVARLSDELYLLTASRPHERRLQLAARGSDAVIENITGRIAALAIIGPNARDVAAAAGVDVADEHLAAQGVIRGVETAARPVHVGAYHGVEIIYPFEEALTLWERVRRARTPKLAPQPIGLDALEILRIEGGAPKPGVDFIGADEAFNPEAARMPADIGLPHLAPTLRAWFNGRRALTAKIAKNASARSAAANERRVIAVVAVDAEDASAGAAVFARDAIVGRVTSWAFSPSQRRVVAFVDIAASALSKPLSIALTESAAADRAEIAAVAGADFKTEDGRASAVILETPESQLAVAALAAENAATDSRR